MGKKRNRNKNKNGNKNQYNQTSLAVVKEENFSVLENKNAQGNKKDEKANNEKKNDEKKDTKSSGSNYGNYYSSYYGGRKNYNYTGAKNVTSYPDFIKICKPSQEKLKEILIMI